MSEDNENGSDGSMLLTPKEAMAQLRCSKATLFKLLRDGEIDSFLLGPNARRIVRASLKAYVDRKVKDDHDDGRTAA